MLPGIPPILYKYRDWGNEWNKRLLFDQELYFPSADQLNDPFDATIPYLIKKEDLTPENIYIKSRQLLKFKYPHWSDSQIEEYIFKSHEVEKILENPDHWEEIKEYQKNLTNEFYGIVSLSEFNDDILMWSHYSNSHTGFCIGFDSEKLMNFSGDFIGPVDYQEENKFPEFGLFEFDNEPEKAVYTLLTTKSLRWQYESEFRLIKNKFPRQKLILPSEIFQEVILGCQMKQSEKFKIIEFVTSNLSHVKIFECKKNDRFFKLDLSLIYEPAK